MENENFCYVFVGNIPSKFHSVDLRSFFSQFIEAEKFQCFHFRHRPEVLKRQEETVSSGESSTLKGKTSCCVVRLKDDYVKELIEVYNRENWVDKDGKLSPIKAVISKITIKNKDESEIEIYQTRKEKRNYKRECVEFAKEDLLKLSELHPPLFMPNGNIGTSLKIFMTLIRTCQLPPQVIKKLGLSFPSGRSKHRYGNVCYDYKTNTEGNVSLCNELTSTVGDNNIKENFKTNVKENYKGDKHDVSDKKDDNQMSEESELDEEEDWERHEALHDDVDCQGRTKERLFENKIELKWEKGGSGLVFYTDAAYWDSLNGDFDEQTADDWDVDMGVYEKGGTGDHHSIALLEMRIEKQRWDGNDVDDDSVFSRKVGEFEKHTKGFGGNLMKKQGWSEGGSLGASQPGIKEPIPNEGQHPHCKKGLGYYGEKLEHRVKRQHVDKEVLISTIYDKTAEKISTPYQSAGPFTLKYRNTVDFVPQKERE